MMKRSLIIIYSLLFVLVVLIIGQIIYQNQPKEQADDSMEETTEEITEREVESENKGEVQKEDEAAETENESQESSTVDGALLDEMDTNEKITYLLEEMTLNEKIGQLIVVGFPSTTVDDHIRKMIEDYHVGGVILFDRNMETPEQVAELNQDLQDLADIPLMISVDQEGGDIVRMREHVSPIPSQQELGSRGDEEEIYSIAKQNGKELKEMGFHVNHAPVLDLSTTDSRCFGEDPQSTYKFGKQVIEGLTDEDITATVKHFPGNGRTDIDPHFESATVDADKTDLENSDIYPFKQMIENVDHSDFFVMVTHLIYPAYDQEYPASVSPVIIQDLLREQLGYEGIVVTDDLEMGAVTDLYTYEELGYHSIKAGADLLLVCHTLESQQQVFNGILQAVENGDLSEEEIDDSVERILKFKFLE